LCAALLDLCHLFQGATVGVFQLVEQRRRGRRRGRAPVATARGGTFLKGGHREINAAATAAAATAAGTSVRAVDGVSVVIISGGVDAQERKREREKSERQRERL
jgi:hypothetical protein